MSAVFHLNLFLVLLHRQYKTYKAVEYKFICGKIVGLKKSKIHYVNCATSKIMTFKMASAKSILTRGYRKLLFKKNYFVPASRPQSLWTKDNIVKSPYKDIEIPNISLVEYVWNNLEKWENKTAVVCAITNKSYTYHDLYKRSRSFAVNLMVKLNLQYSDVVCVMMRNSVEYVVSVLGSIEAGAQLTTVNPIYTPYEVQRQLTLCEPKVLIASSETVKILKQALVLLKKDIPIIVVKTNEESLPEGCISFDEFIDDTNIDFTVLSKVKFKTEDPVLLPYSSGTTGVPKGVELSHRNVIVNSAQQSTEGVKQYRDTTDSHQDSVLAVLPFYHIYGLVIIMLHKLSVGAKLVILPKFHPSTFIPALKDHKINVIFAVPPMVMFLGSYSGVTKDHLVSVNKIVSGAAPLPRIDIDRVLEKSPEKVDFLQIYGLTELSSLATCMKVGSTNYTSVGYPLSNTEMKVCDPNLNTLGPNQIGELLIRGPQIMKGYRNNPEATKNVILEDGWFKSGDLGKIDVTGEVSIEDRLKELIKVKGFQVPPAELESVLKDHSCVLDAAVIGVPHEKTGEVPRGFVVIKDGLTVKPQDIMEFVKSRVAEYKQIKDITFVESLPRNPSGKMLKRVLREKYC